MRGTDNSTAYRSGEGRPSTSGGGGDGGGSGEELPSNSTTPAFSWLLSTDEKDSVGLPTHTLVLFDEPTLRLLGWFIAGARAAAPFSTNATTNTLLMTDEPAHPIQVRTVV